MGLQGHDREVGHDSVRIDVKNFLVAVFFSFNKGNKFSAWSVAHYILQQAHVQVFLKLLPKLLLNVRKKAMGIARSGPRVLGGSILDLLFRAIGKAENCS